MDWTKELEKIERRTQPYWLYVLELEDGCWYVGITKDLKKRYGQHKSGKGAYWTKIHKPIRVVRKEETDYTIESDAIMVESAVTIEYVKKYGAEFVIGGDFTKYDKEWDNTLV